MTQQRLLLLQRLRLLSCVALLLTGGSVLGQGKDVAVVKGTVGKLLPVPDEFKEVQVIAFFILERPEGKKVENANTVLVTVYKDAKVERRDGGKRIPIKAEDIKSGQRIELYDLAEAVRIGDSMRIAANTIVVEERKK